ncbi:MAG: DnaJ domain-containing protein [Clostridia bacterium]|nr:DnaJ domain-containing protein [Clostridia bacterium]MBR4457749.1 DnaJ domain-containing protein [Clostridia bacterium]
MPDALAMLGLKEGASEEEIRKAYRRLARKWHPDQFQDEKQREDATRHMVALNHAYEEALEQASRRPKVSMLMPLDCDEAVKISRSLMKQGYPASALQQLLRASTRSADWYAEQGRVLMEMAQYQSAEQSYREAVRMDPNNITYRAGALDALVAYRNSRSITGRIRSLMQMHKNRR